MSKVPLVAIYARLSNADGIDKESESINNQIELAKDFCNKNGFRIKKIYTDDGFTGSNFDRPGFQSLIEDIKFKRINVVITKDLSRLGRSLLGAGYYLEDFFLTYGVRYIAINDNYDSIDSTSDEMVQIKNLINDLYVKDCRKKIRQSVQRRSTTTVMSTGAYGYNRVDGQLEIIEEQALIVKEIFLRFNSGESCQIIADDLKRREILCPEYLRIKDKCRHGMYGWTYNAVYEILKRKDYLGYAVNWKKKNCKDNPNSVVIPDMIPKIIEEDEFTKTQQILSSRCHRVVLSDDTRLASYYYLDGKVMRFASKPRQGYYWAPGASIDAPKIHEATYQFCLTALKKIKTRNKSFIDEVERQFNISYYQEQKKVLELEYKKIEREYLTLFENFGDGNITELDYQHKLDMCKSKLELNEEQQNELATKISFAENQIKNFYKYIDKLSNIDIDQHPLALIRTVSSRCDVTKLGRGEFKLHVYLNF